MKVTLKIENNSFFCSLSAKNWRNDGLLCTHCILYKLHIVEEEGGVNCKYTLEQIYQTLQKLNSTMFAISTDLPAVIMPHL